MKLNFAAFVLCLLQLIHSSNAAPDDAGSCSSDEKGQVCTEEWKACNDKFHPYEANTLPTPPSVWQKTNCWDNLDAAAVYDLTIIGAGIGGAYVANQLRLNKKHPDASISVMEAGENVGGRLQSSFHSGALGIPVRPFNEIDNVAPPEYGGMRIAPKKYPKIFNQVVKLWNRSFKDQALKANPDAKCSIEFCNNLENVVNCCYGLLTPMNVGFVAYYNGDPDSPNKILSESKLTDSNPLYNEDGASYSVEDIKHYDKYSPFVQTLLIAKGADHYLTKILPTKDQKKALNTSAKKKFKEICSKPICDKIPGYCEMCAQFPNPAEAVTSASGYDLSPIVYPIGAIISVIDEMVNIKNEDFLYLFTVGYQRFAQSLLSGTEISSPTNYENLAVAPHFGKKLVAIGIGPGDFDKAIDNARTLAKIQLDRLHGRRILRPYDGPFGPIRYKFEDGSTTNSHLSYLTMLPRDAFGIGSEGIEGLEPWKETIANNTTPNLAFKAVIQWDNFSLARELGFKPCVHIDNSTSSAGKCQRIILDGPKDGPDQQLVRQAWLWDYKQILVYAAGAASSTADLATQVAKEDGMENLLKRIITQLQESVDGITGELSGEPIKIPQPSWFRAKSWPSGSLLIDWVSAKLDTDQLSNSVRRPFGDSVNVWYGNSEMSKNGDDHGWAEGALDMADDSIPEMKEPLALVL
mmetsp:Transcript_116084/g.237417  ORF Transcript_116084/g.237417 Transcript_116084/m.237417 type:complete len:691 (-) Transcript_116084:362-2434(-)|eukprot:CAMPEP_0201135534 /NCGR_PEP_ID=MMETSP0850-20130426/54367_1 /ASSEMBLY_ACC=CAM_ASM_000622 /TAXON_ID=183588 /ORGANISM="Pseudo-nitzschia fraudulenta, Strain WWA7" /LENGTH=690 /DNA_ID=CAMNT_0047406707 /DNA_START=70 /DNA_END=2142 /DNA_ORIENTATION=+